MGFRFQGGITNNNGFAKADGSVQLPNTEVFLGICSSYLWANEWVSELKIKHFSVPF